MTGSAIVGRDAEIATLRAALDEALAGHGGTALLSGEPGIGKSHLAQLVADLAADAGAEVAWGRAWEAGGAPAFWPWIEVLRALVDARDTETLRGLLGGAASDLASLVPELSDRLALPPASPLAPGAERFRLLDVVASFLAKASQKRGLVVVLDDLHAADPSSLLLLGFVAPRLVRSRALVVGTYRPLEARLSPELDTLVSKVARHARSIALRPLDPRAVEALVADAGLDAAPELIERVCTAAEGNPLFVTEIVRLLRARRSSGALPDDVPIPEGVRGAIRDHLAHLGADARSLLEAASVVGRDFTLQLVADAAGVAVDAARASLDEAARIGLVAEVAAGRWRFAHVLVRDVLYDDAEGRHRTELHQRVAAALETLHASDPDAPLAEIAQHLARAGTGLSLRAIAAWTKAAERATQKLAFEEAVLLTERALALLEAIAPADVARRIELMLALGASRGRAGQLAKSQEICLAAARLAREVGSAEGLARAALLYGAALTIALVDPRLVALLQEALERLPEGDGPLRARALARLAAALQPSKDPEGPLVIARAAIAMARRLDDADTTLAVLNGAGSAMADFADAEERRPVDAELVERARQAGDKPTQLRGLARLIVDELDLADVGAAHQHVVAYATLAAEFRQPHVQWRAHLFHAMMALLVGRFDDAERELALAEVQAARTEDPNTTLCLATHRWAAARIRGEDASDAGKAAVELHFSRFPERWYADVMELVAALPSVDRERALAATTTFQRNVGRMHNGLSLTVIAELCHAAGLAEQARWALGTLADGRSRPERLMGWSLMGVAVEGPIARTYVLLAATAGEWDDAERYFALGREVALRAGALPWIARMELEWAGLLESRGWEGDAARAVACAESAATRGRALRMDALADRAEAMLARLRAAGVDGRADGESVEHAEATSRRAQDAKLASLADLVAGIAHEINNPLGALQSTADTSRRAIDVLKEALEDPEVAAVVGKNAKLARALSVLDRSQGVTPEATSRIARVVTELRRFARLDQADVDRVDLRESLDATVAMLGRELDGRIDMVRAYDADVPTVRCRPRDVHEALLHLLRNAAQAIAGEGTITLGLSTDRDRVVVRIDDTGSGIAPEHLSRIFDPGFTTRGVGVGIGLGLAIVHRIVSEHGGTIEVGSVPGRGSTFVVRLPIDSTVS
ncbi:MAG: AAA family ATPase [Deltaproteobacteria bacterium]|nr:AAA family ATPase [Deltaproteobacteria bacterium]